MKEKFESILLQLKSNLKSDSVINELKTDKDKELHEKLINVVNNYYENIDLFNKEKDSLQKLLFENARNLLEKTNSTSFYLYLPNYRNYANFLVDNYYKNENNGSVNINIEDKLNEFLLKLSNEKKNIDIKPEKFLLNSEEFNLLTKELESRNLIKGQRLISGEYLFQGLTFEGIKYLEKVNNKETEDLTDKMIKKEIIEIPSLKFENLPEKILNFSTWKEVYDWAVKEVKEWEHWYDYISDLPNNIKSAINIHRGATIRLWGESQKLLINTSSERDFKRFSRMAVKALHEVNDSNPIVSYSELGKRMIEAMDDNPDEACHLNYVPNKPIEKTVEVAMSSSLGFGGHNAVIAMKNVGAAAKRGQALTRKSHGVFVPVKAAQFYVAGGAKHCRGMAAHSQGAVKIAATSPGRKSLQRFCRKHRHVPHGFSNVIQKFRHGAAYRLRVMPSPESSSDTSSSWRALKRS